jgi:hypothetical protein
MLLPLHRNTDGITFKGERNPLQQLNNKKNNMEIYVVKAVIRPKRVCVNKGWDGISPVYYQNGTARYTTDINKAKQYTVLENAQERARQITIGWYKSAVHAEVVKAEINIEEKDTVYSCQTSE